MIMIGPITYLVIRRVSILLGYKIMVVNGKFIIMSNASFQTNNLKLFLGCDGDIKHLVTSIPFCKMIACWVPMYS
jgi:hypothetical protein